VPDDATLDDFLDDSAADGEREDSAADEKKERDEAADSATVTFEYDPEGGPCAVCGKTVTERWTDEPGPVCADCKEW